MKYIKTYNQFINESITFQDLYHSKNKWVQFYKRGEYDLIKRDLFVIVGNSYSTLEDNVNINNLDELFDSEVGFWEPLSQDIDSNNNTIVFGKKSAYGKQIIGIGHDGKKETRRQLLEKLVKQLKKPGYWLRSDGELAEILYKMGTPFLEEKAEVEKIYSDIEWLMTDGKYIREYEPGKERTETIFGRPIF